MSEGAKDDLLWRSANSGAMATVRKRSGRISKVQSGDLVAVDPQAAPFTNVFFLELKHRKNLQADEWIHGTEAGLLREIWVKPNTQAKDFCKQALVIAKQDRRHELMLMKKETYELLRLGCKDGILPLRCIFMCNNRWVYVARLQDLILHGVYKQLVPFLEARHRKQERKKPEALQSLKVRRVKLA